MASTHAYAIVHTLDGRDGISVAYQASLFAFNQRLRETGALSRADHVLMLCTDARPGTTTHPDIRIMPFDCAPIDEAVKGKGFHRHLLYRLAPWRLPYERVLLLDLDMYISADLMGAFTYPAPAMVRWENPQSGPFQANGGVAMVRPSEDLYQSALHALRRCCRGDPKERKRALMNMRTPFGAFNNHSRATEPDPLAVMAFDNDQQFFLMFFNVVERARFGPLSELPFAYNFKHYMLKEKQWTAKTYLTFMSHPDMGHIRIVHFNRDKPWTGAQCGPFHHAFWHAASRAVAGLRQDALPEWVDGERGLAAFVREGLRHEEAKPCVHGARTPGVFVQTKRLEDQGHT